MLVSVIVQLDPSVRPRATKTTSFSGPERASVSAIGDRSRAIGTRKLSALRPAGLVSGDRGCEYRYGSQLGPFMWGMTWANRSRVSVSIGAIMKADAASRTQGSFDDPGLRP